MRNLTELGAGWCLLVLLFAVAGYAVLAWLLLVVLGAFGVHVSFWLVAAIILLVSAVASFFRG